MQALHQRALGGEKISADEWRSVLKNANAKAYANAYAYAYAYAYADAWKRLADGMVTAIIATGGAE